MLAQVKAFLFAFRFVLLVALIGGLTYFSYDYGKTTAENAARENEQKLLDKVEQKDQEAYELAVKLANQKPQFKTIEKKVIKYVEKNSDKRGVANDTEWLLLRSDAVREHNQAIGVQQSTAGANDPTKAANSDAPAYTSDGLVLAEDISNIKTCAENAKKLADLQAWISSQMSVK
ncbi:hypothetical protein [Vibrio harveyi]|uniref:hypothetical protein n=1 Tax=Vibrio harveyi TaxID=669 RepID=UPI00034C76B4|nr:hypothetical protein [Vibrio harveyi]GEA22300.1 hypothetical protein VH1807_contig00024-0018 [Vibrio harveyi]